MSKQSDVEKICCAINVKASALCDACDFVRRDNGDGRLISGKYFHALLLVCMCVGSPFYLVPSALTVTLLLPVSKLVE